MDHRGRIRPGGLVTSIAMITLVATLLTGGGADAQTTANGPYYAWPSWDQTLPPSTRFIVLSNFNSQAVLDRETGLVWEKSPATSAEAWFASQARCNGLSVANRKGWRLPTLQELASLVDSSQFFPALPLGHPFVGVQFGFYWSTTSVSINTTGAWGVDFTALGVVETGVKTANRFSWCVRGGQGADPQ